MLNDLKLRAGKTARNRAVAGIIGSVGFVLLFWFNVFGISEEAHSRQKWIAVVACAAVAGCCVTLYFRSGGAGAIKSVKKFCDNTPNPSDTMARLEQTWFGGIDFKLGKMDTEYIIISDGFKLKIFPLDGVVWAYKYMSSVNGIKSSWLYLIYRESKEAKYEFGLNHYSVEQILAFIMQYIPSIAVGYDKERRQMAKNKDWQGFAEHARIQRLADG